MKKDPRRVKLTDNFITFVDALRANYDKATIALEEQRISKAFQAAETLLRRLLPGTWRAAFVHKRLEEEKARDPGPAGYQLSCKAGCSACCHSFVSCTAEEAELLADLVRAGKATVDVARLEAQAAAAATGDQDTWWSDVPWETSACVFLGPDGRCTVYDNRPGPCRLLTSFDNPSKCDKRRNPVNTKIMRWTYIEAEAVYSAYLNVDDTGHLPTLLLAALRRKPK